MSVVRPLLRAVAIPLGTLILLAALVPCLCATPPGSAYPEHGCCAPEAGIQAAAGADCCSSMREASPGLTAPAHEGLSPALAAAPRFDPLRACAEAVSPRATAVAASPPPVLRI